MRNLYEKIELELDKVEFDEIWPGFSKMEFALYNKETVYLKDKEIPYDNRFLGNTSINYNDKNLAIFNVKNPTNENIPILASLIVHEMFHSYQVLNGEKRFPNDLLGLSSPKNLKNYEIKHRENKLIVSALNEVNHDVKLSYLKEIIALRQSRLVKYRDIVKYEMALETLEGSAEYCGTKALKNISKEHYLSRIEDYKGILLKDIRLIFDTRKISYYVGTLLLLLLNDLKIHFNQEIKGNNKYFFEEISEMLGFEIIDIEKIKEDNLEEYYKEHLDSVNFEFEEFFKKKTNKHKGNFMICGYDPMNMIKREDDILCSQFIMLIDEVSKEKIFVQGPVVVRLKPESYKKVQEYYVLS